MVGDQIIDSILESRWLFTMQHLIAPNTIYMTEQDYQYMKEHHYIDKYPEELIAVENRMMGMDIIIIKGGATHTGLRITQEVKRWMI